MKSLHRWSVWLALASFFYACSPAAAQWQVPDHSVPIGRGAGTGFKFATPGTSGNVFTSNGPGADPTFQPSVQSTFVSFVSRSAAIAATIIPSVNALYLSGYSAYGDGGGGAYTRLASPPSPVKAWHFQSADGAWWQLQVPAVFPRQVGAKLDGTTDDTTAIQAWADYSAAFSVVSFGQAGTAAIPTGTINITTGMNIDGLQLLTVQRQSNVVASLFGCNDGNTSPQSGINIRNMTFTTTAGFSSTSSNTITTGNQTWTVAAGLGLTAGENIQITANTTAGARVNYEIAQVVSYSGTTLTTNVVAGNAVGSGTFASWLLDVYPVSGNLAASNIALRFTACSGVTLERNTVSGRFYNAYDTRNGSNIRIRANYGAGYVNRGIHAAAYNGGGSALSLTIENNYLDGQSFSQYGINTSATDGAVAAGLDIKGNRVQNTNFQGIIIGGGVTSSQITDNSVQMSFNTNGAGVLLEGVTGTSGLQVPQTITVKGNTINGGAQGIFIFSTFYDSIVNNTISGAGVGMLVTGATGNPTQFITISGNVVQGSVSHAYQFTATNPGTVTGNVVSGNSAIANAGTGIISDANTSNSNYAGNVSLSNGTAYSIGGTGNVTTGANL